MKRILLCDDDFVIIKLIENKLKEEGFEVVLANNGKKAMEELQNSSFDLIISDMHMPFVTGMELIDFVRNEQKSKTPILIITKDNSDSTTEDAYQLGADDYINKPLNINILSVRVKKLLQ